MDRPLRHPALEGFGTAFEGTAVEVEVGERWQTEEADEFLATVRWRMDWRR